MVFDEKEAPSAATRWMALAKVHALVFLLGRLGTSHARRPMGLSRNAVLLTPCDGFTKPSMIKLKTLEIWIEINDLLDKYAHLS